MTLAPPGCDLSATMALHWTVSHGRRLVLAVARNVVTFADVDSYLTAMAAERALPYRKIFDVSRASAGGIQPDELRRLAERAGHFHKDYVLGPVAIVAATDLSYEMAQVYAQMAEASRSLALFRDMPSARRWLALD